MGPHPKGSGNLTKAPWHGKYVFYLKSAPLAEGMNRRFKRGIDFFTLATDGVLNRWNIY